MMPVDTNTIADINHELNLACDLTQQIINLADKTELDELDSLNQKRLLLIESVFNNDKTKINIELAKKLMHLNEQAMAVLKQQMALNIKQQKSYRKGNAAHHAYMQHSS